MLALRRKFLKAGSAATLLAPLIGTGLLKPTSVLATEWNRTAFTAHNINDALKAFGAANATENRDIVINAPEIAENGAKVEVEISCNLSNARTLAVFSDKNPMPLCASFEFSGNVLPYTRLQLKLAESTRIRAVVKTSEGKTYVSFREVKVTLGGCGA
jgi:sulfur-oxidizing protein SoxY